MQVIYLSRNDWRSVEYLIPAEMKQKWGHNEKQMIYAVLET